MTLRAQGLCFVRRGAEFKWIHRAEWRAGDLDCTLMSDERLRAAIGEAQKDTFLHGVRVTEMFANDVPRVRGEHRVKPSGMPPDWTLTAQQVAGADSMMGSL